MDHLTKSQQALDLGEGEDGVFQVHMPQTIPYKKGFITLELMVIAQPGEGFLLIIRLKEIENAEPTRWNDKQTESTGLVPIKFFDSKGAYSHCGSNWFTLRSAQGCCGSAKFLPELEVKLLWAPFNQWVLLWRYSEDSQFKKSMKQAKKKYRK